MDWSLLVEVIDLDARITTGDPSVIPLAASAGLIAQLLIESAESDIELGRV